MCVCVCVCVCVCESMCVMGAEDADCSPWKQHVHETMRIGFSQ